ncbi:MAG: winged helix-turn-helix domain-containing protein [Burkholderiaceae bacterium]
MSMSNNGRAEGVEMADHVFHFGPMELRSASGVAVPLRPQTLAVLACLARRPGELVSKNELMRAVWPGVAVTDDSLVQCVTELRKAIGDAEHLVIRTEPKRGYRLIARASQANDPTGSLPATDFKQEIHFACTPDGVRIAYALSGSGPPLVRAPHWMTHLDWDWRSSVLGPRIQEWSRSFRLLRYDARGIGLSDRGGAPRGGRRRGERSMAQADYDAMLRLIEYGWGQDNDAYRQISTSMLWPGASTEQMHSFNHLQRVSCEPRTAAAQMRAMSEMDCTGDLANVQCPTLVLHSPKDARVPFEEGRLIASGIPGARLEPFDSPNHTPLYGEPAYAQVQRLTEEFLLGASNLYRLTERTSLADAPARQTSG